MMTTGTEQAPQEDGVKLPRVTLTFMGLYEGLGRMCDSLDKERLQGSLSEEGQSTLAKYRTIYQRHVGVNPEERNALREAAQNTIKAEKA